MEELKDQLLKSPTGKQWERIGVRQHHGINLPLSALHSQNSCGIGEFFDLMPIIDWCKGLNIDFIQLLPLNNSNSESDPSPYNAVSSCAINFLYLSLHALPHLEDFPALKEKLGELKKFNKTEKIAYSDVVAHKKNWLREYYKIANGKLLQTKEFQEFQNANSWLDPYTLFITLKEELNQTSWKTWPEELRYPTPVSLAHLYQLHQKEMSFYLFLQFLCYLQLKKLRDYARERGIFLMGDIPILLSSESADIWQYPDLFDSHLSAGAPPDAYNAEGQNWGFPIFNWDALRKTHFEWWKQRLRYAENFFDICRLDHIIGFFRIWAIPPHHHSKEGHFIPEDEKEWEYQGKEILTLLVSSTTMLPIGEDLGVVPEIVDPCLEELGICGTKVIRWEKHWDEADGYIPIQEYSPISITCCSTHDSETLSLWWKSFSEESKAYAKGKGWIWSPTLTPEQRQQILWDSHHSASLFHANLLQEYLAFFPQLSWPDPKSERINVPGKILPTNWTYRFRPSVEEITSHKELFSKMKSIIS